MPYASNEIMGLGSYVGEIGQAPDGQLYEWVEGVDGLGNPIGFWKKLKSLAKVAAPFASFLPIPGAAAAAQLAQRFLPKILPAAAKYARKYGAGIPGAQQYIQKGEAYAKGAGLLGEVAEGPDGQLYEVVEGNGAMGAPKRLRLCIPAYVSGGKRRGMRPTMPGPVPAPGMQPPVQSPAAGMRPPAQAAPARRFR
ncbi:MAG: hypothetical protein ACREOI_07785 [bacterium]